MPTHLLAADTHYRSEFEINRTRNISFEVESSAPVDLVLVDHRDAESFFKNRASQMLYYSTNKTLHKGEVRVPAGKWVFMIINWDKSNPVAVHHSYKY